MDGNLTPLQRFFLAFAAFFAVLFNRRFAEEVALLRARTGGGSPAGPRTEPARTAGGARAATATVNANTTRTSPSPQPSVRPEGSAGEAGAEAKGALPRGAGDETSAPAAPAAGSSPAVKAATADGAAAAALRPAAARPARAVTAAKPPEHAEALHVLSLLQRDGRLIDFLAESLEGFSDAEIGAAARTVHQGCKKALDAYLELEPVYRDAEGATVTVAAGFDPAAVRLTGNVVGAPPFTGALRHHGWRARRAAFPPPPQRDANIIAPAEVEL